jgi:hypothetical protein
MILTHYFLIPETLDSPLGSVDTYLCFVPLHPRLTAIRFFFSQMSRSSNNLSPPSDKKQKKKNRENKTTTATTKLTLTIG